MVTKYNIFLDDVRVPTDVSVVVDIAQPHTKWRLQTNDKD